MTPEEAFDLRVDAEGRWQAIQAGVPLDEHDAFVAWWRGTVAGQSFALLLRVRALRAAVDERLRPFGLQVRRRWWP